MTLPYVLVVALSAFFAPAQAKAQAGSGPRVQRYVTHYYVGKQTVLSHFSARCAECPTFQGGKVDISGLPPYDGQDLYRCPSCYYCEDTTCRTDIIQAMYDPAGEDAEVTIRVTHLAQKGRVRLTLSGDKGKVTLIARERTFSLKN